MSSAKHILFLIDACLGGMPNIISKGFNDSSSLKGLIPGLPNYILEVTNNKSRQILTAGGRGEQVIEKSGWGHSAFTKNLITALYDGKSDRNLDGIITSDELGMYVETLIGIVNLIFRKWYES